MFKALISLILWSNFSLAAEMPGFKTLDDYSPTPGSTIEFKEMPPYGTQDGLGTCFSSAGAAYLDIMNCKYERSQKCTKYEEKDSFSRIAIGKYGRKIEGDDYKDEKFPGIYPSDGKGRNASNILRNVIYGHLLVPTEACASLEKALINFQDTQSFNKSADALFKDIKTKYDEAHKCPTCAVSLAGITADDLEYFKKNLNLQQNNVDILAAFSEKTYGEFLEKLLVPKCNRGSQNRSYDGPRNLIVEDFPETKSNQNQILEKIKSVLKRDTPLILNNICLSKKYDSSGCGVPGTDDPPELHTLIINGYRKVCDKNNKCRDSVKVYNSAGASWQKMFDDGWVDAEVLLNRTGYVPGVLTYAELQEVTAKADTGQKTTVSK